MPLNTEVKADIDGLRTLADWFGTSSHTVHDAGSTVTVTAQGRPIAHIVPVQRGRPSWSGFAKKSAPAPPGSANNPRPSR